MMHYFVIGNGIMSFFEEYLHACAFADDIDGRVYNIWGIARGKK